MLASKVIVSGFAVPISIPRERTPAIRLGLLGLLTLVSIVVFMTIDAGGNWDFVIPFRARKVMVMAMVGVAIAVSTVAFQTITQNRILSPSIMGFDALYMLIQTIVVFFFGSQQLLTFDPRIQFGIEVALMTLFSTVLFWIFFLRAHYTLYLIVMIGIIFGALFRSATNFAQRMIEPNDFAVLQDASFANFNAADPTLMKAAAVLLGGAVLAIWRVLPELDLLLMGREMATGLGLDYRRAVGIVLIASIVLTAVSTALVGPVAFFGLLVANLAYLIAGSPWHRYTLPAAALLGMMALIGGQAVLEHVFGLNSSLSVIVEFAGGVAFILLVLRSRSV